MIDRFKKGYNIILNKVVRKINSFKSTNHEKVFSKVYSTNMWGESKSERPFYSGTGSDEGYAIKYSDVLTEFIKVNGIKSMVDLGCGDFRVGNEILKGANIKYTGVDVVPELIAYNNTNFGNSEVSFKQLNIVKNTLPKGELCTIRQVLQHLSNSDVMKVLKKCTDYKYLIITEHLPVEESPNPNVDKQPNEHIRLMYNSGIYLDKPPFNYRVKELLTVNPEAEKGSKIVTYQVWLQ